MSPIAFVRDVGTRSSLVTREEGRTQITTTTSSLPIVIGATVAVIVVLIGIIVGIAIAWKHSIRQRKKREAAQGNASEAKEDVFAAHPPKPILRPTVPPSDAGVGWTPQIRAIYEKALPDISLEKEQEKEKDAQYIIAPAKASPPPSYTSGSNPNSPQPRTKSSPVPSPLTTPEPSPQPLVSRFSLPSPRSPRPVTERIEIVLPTPTERQPGSSLPPTPATPCLAVEFSVDPPSSPMGSARPFPPTPSPRSASFRTAQNLPRQSRRNTAALMTVVHTFTAERDDELAVTLGETLQLVHAYQDGWCLVQRAPGRGAPQGVIPQFCLQAKTDPTQASSLQVPNV